MKNYLNPLYISLIIYIAIIILVIWLKPPMFYLNNDPKTNKLKIFGTGSKNTKTIFPLWFIIIVLAILIYFIIVSIF